MYSHWLQHSPDLAVAHPVAYPAVADLAGGHLAVAHLAAVPSPVVAPVGVQRAVVPRFHLRGLLMVTQDQPPHTNPSNSCASLYTASQN